MIKGKNERDTDAYGRYTETGNNLLAEEKSAGVSVGKTGKRYADFFEGYAEYALTEGNRKRVVREYVGDIYRQHISDRKAIVLRILYVFLELLCIASFAAALIVPSPANSCWYTMLIVMLAAFFIIKNAFSVAIYALSKRDMKVREYRKGPLSFKKNTFYLCISVIIELVSVLVMYLLSRNIFPATEFVRCALLIFSCGLTLAISFIDSKVKYEKIIPSQTQIEDGVCFESKTALSGKEKLQYSDKIN